MAKLFFFVAFLLLLLAPLGYCGFTLYQKNKQLQHLQSRLVNSFDAFPTTWESNAADNITDSITDNFTGNSTGTDGQDTEDQVGLDIGSIPMFTPVTDLVQN